MESTDIQYRFLHMQDVDQLSDLYQVIFNKSVDPTYFKIKYSLRDPKQLQLTTVAVLGDKIIGCFGVQIQEFRKKGIDEPYTLASACDFFMLPAYQGKGIFKNLYEHSKASCKELKFDMYAFHSTQTYKVCKKMGWTDSAHISRFHIKAFPFSTSKLVRMIGLNRWRNLKIQRLFEIHKTTMNLEELNRNSEVFKNTYTGAFLESKDFCPRHFVEIEGCVLLLKYAHVLTVGFVSFGESADIASMLKKLKMIARRTLVHEVVFQLHSKSSEARELRLFLEEKPSFQVSSIALTEKRPNFSEVQLNFLDMDIF